MYQASLASASILLGDHVYAAVKSDFPVVRTPESKRKFKSPAVERLIQTIKKDSVNPELAWLFENCFPNTLDTTVDFEIINGKPDTFVITGDIDAMWLRDSSAQVWPYLPLMKEDPALKELIRGVINRQAKCILKDPYANAFYKDERKVSEWKDDHTTMLPGVHERKWEIDSLCYPVRLAHGYWKETGDSSVFDEQWKTVAAVIVKIFREQQRMLGTGPYQFQRKTSNPTDSVPMNGYGYPTKKTGLIHSVFRPSDDATVFAFNIPGNLFALKTLEQLKEIGTAISMDQRQLDDLVALYRELKIALDKESVAEHPVAGKVYPYEVNGLGSRLFMDDSNVPSLLSLPYLGCTDGQDPVYRNTRRMLLSEENPFYFSGRAASGIGGPHVGMDYIWPLSITMQALTSSDDQEIRSCLDMLRKTHAGTGFMHEAFNKDNPSKYTRSWFAWANTLFGELIWKLYREKKQLLS